LTTIKRVARPCFLVAAFLPCLSAQPQQGGASAPIGELFPSDIGAAAEVQPVGTGMPVLTGSELSAGVAPARFRMNRGGQVRICPRSTLTVNAGATGLLFSMGNGAVVIDYRLNRPGTDVLLTPDFNIQLAGPGAYHLAIGVDKNGTTCMKALPGNGSQVTVNELLGTGVYRSKANEAVSFVGGKLSATAALASDCGCPPAAPTMIAKAQPSPAPAAPVEAPPLQPGERVPVANPSDATAPLPADRPGQVHVQVDAPFVYSAKGDPNALKPYSVARVQFSNLPNVFFAQEQVDPIVLKESTVEVSANHGPPAEVKPVAEKKKEKKGFFGRVKGFFGSIFRR
jgi:hypothetical protein